MSRPVYCSFCGRSSDDAGPVLEKTDQRIANRWVRICRECAELAIQAIDEQRVREGSTPLPT